MLNRLLFVLPVLVLPLYAQPEVIATGLQTPQKLLLTPRGNFLVSEPSMTPNSGRVSFVTRGGQRRSLIEGLPSGIEVTLAAGSGPSGLALRDRTLYLSISTGDAERRGTAPGTTIHNPAGTSSPLFSSVLAIQLSADLDAIGGTFRMTLEQQRTLADGAEVRMDDGSGSTARVSVLANLPDSEPDANTLYRFSNPWGLTLTEDGRSLYANDASNNSVVKIDTTTGRWQRVARFAPVANTGAIGPPVVDIVPTSVRLYGDRLLVSFLTGFPFAPFNSRVLSVNPETGASGPFISNLTSATDVLWRPRPGGRAQFYVLEFSANQSATPPPPGRLLRFDTAEPTVAAAPLITPVSMAYDESTNDLFILELRGQILRLRLD